MTPRGRALASRHLICASCSSWIPFNSSGCTNSWAEMRGVFTFNGCTDVTRLVGEVGELRQIMESMKRMITRQGLEEEIGETGIRVARLEETEEKEKCKLVMTPGNSSTEESRNGKETAERSSSKDRGTVIAIEGEHGTEGEEKDRQLLGGKGIHPGIQMLATHIYKKNPDGPVGNELDLSEGETLAYLMKHDDNEHVNFLPTSRCEFS